MSINLSVAVDAKGNPTVTPHVATIAKDEKNVKLVWVMATPGYHIDDIKDLPDNEFTGKAKRDTGYEIKDKNDEANSYPYTVVISHDLTGRKVMVDPTIKNEG